jgi:hypothetical protein
MTMTTFIARQRIAPAVLLMTILLPSPGNAEEEEETVEVKTPATPERREVETESPAEKLRASGPSLLGVLLELLPVGTITANPAQGPTSATDAAFAVGVAAFVDEAVTRFIAIGISPQVVFRSGGAGDARQSATQVDLRGRLTGRAPVSPDSHLYGRLSPGYSLMLLPESWGKDVPMPRGFILDFSVGAELRVLPNLFAVLDLGYQFGLQSTLSSQYLHIGAGLAYAF